MMNKVSEIKKTVNLVLAEKVAQAKPLGEIKDKVVIISGASKGLGKAIADNLYNEGCKLTVFARTSKELAEAFPAYKYENILVLEGDVSSEQSAKDIVAKTIEKFGHIDVVINNAGINLEKPLETTTSEEVDNILDTNIKGAINMTIAALPHLKSRKSGTIINIGSKISHNTNVGANKVLYATTKYAIEGFSFALNKELKGSGVRVVCVIPGTINTFVSLNAGNFMSPDRVAQIIAMIIKFDDVDFESLVFKSKDQNI
ncbi:MAG TPA: SDR family NAD(P)-dependent oxidoreductase [Candidatus Saccharimonadales bacterium]|nr:SDR family NAD(P)-dependent oxidoreductase [Candidatus Saccharimonadales bacterium]